MSIEEVMAYRQGESAAIIDSLRRFGNLEPPGFIGRAYSAGERPFLFTAANYLHVAAFLRDNPRHDSRFLSEEAVAASGTIIPQDAPAVTIERWNVSGPNNIQANLVKYYNIQDIPGTAYRAAEADLPASRVQAIEKLTAAGYPVEAPAGSSVNDAIFDGYYQAAADNGLQPVQAKLAAQLALKSHQLTRDYAAHPLLTETEIDYYAAHTDELYRDTVKANKVFKAIESGLIHGKQQAAAEDQNLFADLTVVYHWSERFILDPQGVPYDARVRVCPNLIQSEQKNVQEGERLKVFDHDGKHYLAMKTEYARHFNTYWQVDQAFKLAALSIVKEDCKETVQCNGKPIDEHVILYDYSDEDRGQKFTGKDAYEFLAMLNRADKESFDQNSILSRSGYDKTKLDIHYKDIQINDRVDLGDLELGNASTVAGALEHYLAGRYQGNDFSKIQKILEPLKQDEAHYLGTHPGMKNLNEQRADVYLYGCSPRQFKEIPVGLITKIVDAKDLTNVYTISAKAYKGGFPFDYLANKGETSNPYEKTDPFSFHETIEPKDSMVYFESSLSPLYLLRREYIVDPSLTCIVSQKELEAVRQLSNLHLEVSEDTVGKQSSSESYTGIDAIKRFMDIKKTAAKRYHAACVNQINTNNCEWNLKLDYKDAMHYEQSVQVNEASLPFLKTDDLPVPEEKASKEELQTAIHAISKYSDFAYTEAFPRYSSLPDLFFEKEPPKLPTRETSLAALEKTRPDLDGDKTSEFYHDVARYYYDKACIQADSKTDLDAFGQNFAIGMARDGIPKRTMNSVVNRISDPTLYAAAAKGVSSKEALIAAKETKKAMMKQAR